jgi:anti-anti-sigma factor
MVIEVGGRLAAATAPQLTAALASAIAGADHRIVLDLKGLDYISSAGVLVLETAAARLRSDGRALVLSGPTPPVRLALTLAGFPDDVEVIEKM